MTDRVCMKPLLCNNYKRFNSQPKIERKASPHVGRRQTRLQTDEHEPIAHPGRLQYAVVLYVAAAENTTNTALPSVYIA